MIRDVLFQMRPLPVPKQAQESETPVGGPFSYFSYMEPDEDSCVFDTRKGDSPAARARIKN